MTAKSRPPLKPAWRPSSTRPASSSSVETDTEGRLLPHLPAKSTKFTKACSAEIAECLIFSPRFYRGFLLNLRDLRGELFLFLRSALCLPSICQQVAIRIRPLSSKHQLSVRTDLLLTHLLQQFLSRPPRLHIIQRIESHSHYQRIIRHLLFTFAFRFSTSAFASGLFLRTVNFL